MRTFYFTVIVVFFSYSYVADTWSTLDYVTSFFRHKCVIRDPETFIDELQKDLDKNLFGQHLAMQSVLTLLDAHFFHDWNKALVIHFQGLTGVGKTYTAFKIAKHLFGDREKNPYVHFYNGRVDFKDQKKQEALLDDVTNSVKICDRSMFIFDEIEELPDGFLDVLKPFFDHYDSYRGVDYRNTTFIFISNIGGPEIAKICFKYRNAKQRNELELKDFQSVLMDYSYNSKGGLKNTGIVKNHLVDFYVPFLPLEVEHVKYCILMEIEMYSGDISDKERKEALEYVVNELSFDPKTEYLYSTSGCKRVRALVLKYFGSRKFNFKEEL